MDRFLELTSTRDQSSLAALKVILKSTQVNADTSCNYHAISLFLDKVLDSYLLVYTKEDSFSSDKG